MSVPRTHNLAAWAILKENCQILFRSFFMVFMVYSQRNILKGDFPSENFPSGNFPNVHFSRGQHPKGYVMSSKASHTGLSALAIIG